MDTTPLSPQALDAALAELRRLLPALTRLMAAPLRELTTEEAHADTDKLRDLVADRLMEVLDDPRALAFTHPDRAHIALGEVGIRLHRFVERRRLVCLNIPANRVLYRALQSAAFALSRQLRRDDLPDATRAELRRLRSAVLAFLPSPTADAEERVGPMSPGDLLDRSLRYAPRYAPVLAFYALSRQLRRTPDGA